MGLVEDVPRWGRMSLRSREDRKGELKVEDCSRLVIDLKALEAPLLGSYQSFIEEGEMER